MEKESSSNKPNKAVLATSAIDKPIKTLEVDALKTSIESSKHSFHRVQEQISRLKKEAITLEAEGDNATAKKIRLQAEVIDKDLIKLQEEVAKAPFMADALGLGINHPSTERYDPKAWVKESKFNFNKVERESSKGLNSQILNSAGPRDPIKVIDNQIVADPKLSKLRLSLGDETGRMAPNATYRISAKSASQGNITLKEGRTDTKGYTSVSLGHISISDIDELHISVADNSDSEITHSPYVISKEDLLNLVAHQPYFVPVEKNLIDKLQDRLANHDGPPPAGTIEDPDEVDLQASPDSFGLNEEHVDGNCCLRANTGFAAKEYYFRQTVRLTDVEDVNLVFTGGKDVQREEVKAPIDFRDEGPSTYAVLGGNLLLGLVNTYRNAWYPAGRGLGRLLYSTSLAPCEEINLAFIDWSRRERDSRRESRMQGEQVEHEMQHDRSIDEVVDATVAEQQNGSSASGGGGASLDLGFISIGGGGGGTSSSSSGRRSLHASTVQDVSESITQQSSSIRHQRATVVTSSYQRESERIKTRNIHNHNKNHIMNLEYFQVVEHYNVKTELVEEKPVLLIPYQIDNDIFGTISSYQKYIITPSVPITRFLDRHSRILRRMVPWRYRRSFKSLSRLLHCRDIYKIEAPFATFSRWDINLDNAWRPGVSLRINTHSGQSVKLHPVGGSSTNPPSFYRSTPIKDEDIKSITVAFDSSEALKKVSLPGIFGDLVGDILDDLIKYKLENITVSATTDRTRYLTTPQSFLIEDSGVNTTLSSSNPSVEISLTAPTPDFSGYRGREHEDYCRLKELIAEIQSNPMRYMRAIWLTENPDRRAIRFDQFKLNGKSLLDMISNRPRGILGNYVAFDLLDAHKLVAIDSPDFVVSNRVVTLPTRGVFGEVFLSCCNATEKRDVERFIDPDQRCQSSAPDISGVSPGSRASRGNTTPTDFAAPIVNLQTAPTLPNPTGMANATSLLSTPDIFRDMSNAKELLQFIDNATKEAFTSTRQHRAAMNAIAGDVVKGLVSAYTGAPMGGGSSAAPGATQSGTTGIKSTPNSGTSAPANITSGGQSEAGQIVNGQLVRQTNPTQISDNIQTIRRAVSSGELTQEQGNAAINQLVGNTASTINGYNPNQPSLTLIQPSTTEGLAFNPSSQDKSNEITLEVTATNVPTGGRIEWSCADPSAVVFDTPNQSKTTLAGIKPGPRTVTCSIFDASGVQLAKIDVPLSIPQFIRVTENTTAFESTLTNFNLLSDKTGLLQAIKAVTERTLSTCNTRLIWEMAPFNETMPAIFQGPGLAFGNVTEMTLAGASSSPALPGITQGSAHPNNVGPNFFNETIDIFPGALDDPAAAVNVDDALQKVIASTTGSTPDATQQALKLAMIGRYTGVVMAHEVVHSLIGLIRNPNNTMTPHNSPAIPGCLMNTGAVPSTEEVTGIDINDMATFPAAASYSDKGVAVLLLPSAHVQAQIDLRFPTTI